MCLRTERTVIKQTNKPNIEASALINKICVDLPVQYYHATWIADVPHGEELAFPWLFPRGVNGLSADRSKRYVDARWRKNITYLMFACNYMEQQRLSSEIGIQMHVCKSNNPNDKFTANDFFNEEIRSQCL